MSISDEVNASDLQWERLVENGVHMGVGAQMGRNILNDDGVIGGIIIRGTILASVFCVLDDVSVEKE